MRVPYLIALVFAIIGVIVAYAHWPHAGLPEGVTADRIIVLKSERRLQLYQGDSLLREYRVALGFNPVGAKNVEGDGRTPEGRYIIDRRNPHSQYHLSLHISYPTAEQIRQAKVKGFNPGGLIMIHGMRNGLGAIGRLHRLIDWTAGCIAVTNKEIEEIWRVVPNGTTIEIRA